MLLHAAAVSDSTGRYYVGQFQDISERICAEQAVQALQMELARQVEIHATILDNLPSGAVFLVDRELRYLSASGPGVLELLGVPADEVVGRNARELIPARYQEEVLARLNEALRGRKVAFEAARGQRVFEARMAPIYSGEPLPVAAPPGSMWTTAGSSWRNGTRQDRKVATIGSTLGIRQQMVRQGGYRV